MATLNLAIKRGTTYGPITFTCRDSQGAVVPLAGWAAYAQIRSAPGSPQLYLDLAPVIAADDSAGLITIPQLSPAITASLPSFIGEWDLILESPDGIRLTDPILSGSVTVKNLVTQL